MSKLKIRDSFWLMLAVAVFLDEECLLPAFFSAAAVHEGGHWLAVRLCGGTVTALQLSAGGGLLTYRLARPAPGKDAAIALAGSAAGLLLALCARWLDAPLLAGASLILSVFNLLPIPPLDGGRALCALCPFSAVNRAAACFFAALVFFAGLYAALTAHGWGLACIGLFLILSQQAGLQSWRKRDTIIHT